MKKLLSLMLTLVLTITMSFGVMSVAAFAEEVTQAQVIVKVTKGEVSKDINMSELKLSSYSYSSINNAATMETVKVKGVTLASLLKKAGVTAGKNDAIEIESGGSKPGSVVLNYSDLYGKKYRYKNLVKMHADKGPIKTKYGSKVRVYPVIALEEDDNLVLNARIYFGQAFAADRNAPRFFDHIKAIKVIPAIEKTALSAPVFVTTESATVGDVLEFEDPETCSYIYYTVNGYKPTVTNSRIYNYGPKAKPVLYNKFTFNKAGNVTVKAVMKGYKNKDKSYFKDSTIVTKKITVLPAKAEITSVTPGKKVATVKFKSQKSSGISGYKVLYQKAGDENWKSVNVKNTKTSYKMTKLESGAEYTVTVQAYKKISKKNTIYGEKSEPFTVVVE